MKIHGLLERAQCEMFSGADPTDLLKARIWFRTDTNELKIHDGTTTKVVSMTDDADPTLVKYDHVVGSAADVTNGLATSSDLSVLAPTVSANDTIYVRRSYVASASNIIFTVPVHIMGEGLVAIMQAPRTLFLNGGLSTIERVLILGTLNSAAVGSNFIKVWKDPGGTITSAGSDNLAVI